MKIFGRDPVVWTSLIEAVLVMILSLNLFGLRHEMIALIMAVVLSLTGVYTAYVTNQTMLGYVLGLTKAVLALAIGFGFEFGADRTAALIAMVTVLVGFFHRTQASPVVNPNFNTDPLASVNLRVMTKPALV